MNNGTTPKVQAQGTGTFTVPGAVIPPPRADEMLRNAATDLAAMLAIRPDSKNAYEEMRATAIAWITRCAHVEIYARALEADLEKLRNGK